MYLVGAEGGDLDYLLAQGTHLKVSDRVVTCRACQNGRLRKLDVFYETSYGQS